MHDSADRTDRFEMIAACGGETLVALAEGVLDGDTAVTVLQAPRPQLVMQRVREPVREQTFNLGEVLVTAAEVELGGARGFAMVPGKTEAAAVAGAIVDAAVAADHPHAGRIVTALDDAMTDRETRRQRQWAESRATTVEFATMEGEL